MSSAITDLWQEIQGVKDEEIIRPKHSLPAGARIVGEMTPLLLKIYTVMMGYDEQIRVCRIDLEYRDRKDIYEPARESMPRLQRRLAFLQMMLSLEAIEYYSLTDDMDAQVCKEGVVVLDKPPHPFEAFFKEFSGDHSSEPCTVCGGKHSGVSAIKNLADRLGIPIPSREGPKEDPAGGRR